MRGHVHKRQWKGRGGKVQVLWYAVVDVGAGTNGKRKQKWHGGFKTRREAEAALAEIVRSLEENTYITPHRVTLGEFAEQEWLPMMKSQVKKSTWDSYRRNIENHVLPLLGGTALQQLSTGHLNSLYRTLLSQGRRGGSGKGLSPKTVRNVHGAISKLLTDAADRGLVNRNIATNARPPRSRTARSKEINFWRPAELSRFLVSVRDDRLYALWHLAAMTGMRRGELLGLRWSDVDLRYGRVSIRQGLVSVGYELTITTPKSHNARVVDIDPETVAVLRRYRTMRSAERTALGLAGQVGGDDLVFGKPDGTIIHPDIITQTFDKRVAKSGVRRIRLHDLRHTHATIGLRAGVPVKVMSERLGHATPAFTLQQYAHVIPGMQAEAAEAIANLIDEASGGEEDDLYPDRDEDDNPSEDDENGQ